jgi:DNA polymerase-3 subunit gamma/tau
MSEALALKYRPKKLSEVVGQGSVVQTLANAFGTKHLHHAYLFSGPFGCGKTSCARIVAARLNCEKGGNEPCGECKICQQIFDGQCTDVREMNAASNRGIDDMRFLADYAADHPLVCKWKVIIIDECHGLSREAVESALKLIEEPPARVIFILCTTDPQKMKMTIHSRCIPFRFSKVAWPEILAHLKTVAEKEKIAADEGALKVAARLAKGSMRNAVNNLQLLVTFAGSNPITAELAQQAFGSVRENDYFELVDAVIAKDAEKGIRVLHEIFSQGQDVERITEGMTEHLRNLMVLTSCKSTAGLIYLSDEEKKRYVHQYQKVSIDLVVSMIGLLYEATRRATLNVSPQTIFEAFLVQSIMKHAELERLAKGSTAK